MPTSLVSLVLCIMYYSIQQLRGHQFEQQSDAKLREQRQMEGHRALLD